MSDESAFAGWDDIDTAGAADSFQAYLDAVTGLERMELLKRRSHELLSPAAGDRLLDVGCGNGDDVRTLAETVGPTGSVVGVDNSSAMVEEARSRASGSDPTTFEVADAEGLPFDDATFDGCRSDRVLQHLQQPRQAFSELRRVTRPGGRVVVTDADWATMVVDPAPEGDEAAAARMAEAEWACARNGRIGRRLRRWAVDAGLTDLDVDAETIVLTDFETADEVLGLTGRAESLRESGAFSPAEVDRWLDSLQAADEAGSFFGSLCLYTVGGTVQESLA